MIRSLQLVPAKPITMRLGKVQIVLIKTEVSLFVGGERASDAFKSIEFGPIQFEAFAPDSSHNISYVARRPQTYLITNRHFWQHKF
jgi:hypothetical protein